MDYASTKFQIKKKLETEKRQSLGNAHVYRQKIKIDIPVHYTKLTH